jgi:nucleotidyltransferase substrate binding protein (TIGR01987 family)
MTGENQDIRWQQRLISYNKAYDQLKRFVETEDLNEMESQGLIKAFEYTYELACKTLQDLLEYNGYQNIAGPRPVIEQSFRDGYIIDGNLWMAMHQSRNLTSHTYEETTAKEIIEKIRVVYFDLFKDLKEKLEKEMKLI